MAPFSARLAWLSLLLIASVAAAQDTAYPPVWEQIPGPDCAPIPQWNSTAKPKTCSRAEIGAWLADIRHWRSEHLIRMGYDGSQYERPELKWTQSSFVQPQMMVHDLYFYDRANRRYTVDRYLDDLEKRYGGIDSVLIWHTYPEHGNRQPQPIRSVPRSAWGRDGRSPNGAGLPSPRRPRAVPGDAVGPGHARRRRAGLPTPLPAKLMAAVGADGINGDTLDGVPGIVSRGLRRDRSPAGVRAGRRSRPTKCSPGTTFSWGYWNYHFRPMVSRYKWLEPRHMVNVCDRWSHDHDDNLQAAVLQRRRYESWENIWGIWNQMTPRDAEALRRIATIERAFAPLLLSPDWEPHISHRAFWRLCQQVSGRRTRRSGPS